MTNRHGQKVAFVKVGHEYDTHDQSQQSVGEPPRTENLAPQVMAAIHGDLKLELHLLPSWATELSDNLGEQQHRGYGNRRTRALDVSSARLSSSQQVYLRSFSRIPTSSSSAMGSQMQLGTGNHGNGLTRAIPLPQQDQVAIQQEKFDLSEQFPSLGAIGLPLLSKTSSFAALSSIMDQFDRVVGRSNENGQRLLAPSSQHPVGLGLQSLEQFSDYDCMGLQSLISSDSPQEFLVDEWDTEISGPSAKRPRLLTGSFSQPVGLSSIRDSLPATRRRRDQASSRTQPQEASQRSTSQFATAGSGVNVQGINEMFSRFNSVPQPQIQAVASRPLAPFDSFRSASVPSSPLLDIPVLSFPGNEVNRRLQTKGILEAGWPSQGLGLKSLNSLGAANDINAMEKLLVHCAEALESKDFNLAHQIMWVVNNVISGEGDPNQRLTSSFLKALVRRAGMVPSFNAMYGADRESKTVSAVEYAVMVDITPWYRFGFKAANGIMIEAFEGKDKIHIVDFTTTYGMQWPTLIEALADRSEGPPHVRLTVHKARPQAPPYLGMTQEDVIARLILFANTKNVDLEVRIVSHEIELLDSSMFDIREDEFTVANCMFRARFIPDETANPPACSRDTFLRLVHSLNPALVTLVDEEAMVTSTSLVTRLKAAFNYMWMPFDALDTFLPRDSPQRVEYELNLAEKIENIIAKEGLDRIERMETKDGWGQRMKKAGFEIVPFGDDVSDDVKVMLSDHAAGWGMKQEQNAILLTWKGHSVLFATVWKPSQATSL